MCVNVFVYGGFGCTYWGVKGEETRVGRSERGAVMDVGQE